METCRYSLGNADAIKQWLYMTGRIFNISVPLFVVVLPILGVIPVCPLPPPWSASLPTISFFSLSLLPMQLVSESLQRALFGSGRGC